MVGPAGSGKSTLGRLLKGLIEPTVGTVRLSRHSKETNSDSQSLLSAVGWADAQPERQIFAETVWKEVAFGAEQRGLIGSDLTERVEWALKTAGLDPEQAKSLDPLMLSGGSKRRVALASAVSAPSDFVIFDEPAAGLDASGVKQIRDLIWQLGEAAVGTLIITHDPEEFRDLIDGVWMMACGELTRTMPVAEVDWEGMKRSLEQRDRADV